MSKNYDYSIKLLMIGDSDVGKTSILTKYVNDQFSNTFITTIGIDFKIKYIKVNNKNIKLQLWDTAGQERFRSITISYFRGAQGAIVTYNVTDRSNFFYYVSVSKTSKYSTHINHTDIQFTFNYML